MKLSKVIALSALTTSLCTILLVLGSLVLTLSYSAIFLASVIILLPLAKNTYKGAVLSVIASGLLSFCIASFSFETSLPFVLFFGFHPIVSKFFRDKKFNKVLAFIIKDVWFLLAMLACYYLTEMFITDNEVLQKYMLYIILIGGNLFFAVYDYMLYYFQRAVDKISVRLKI